MTRWHPLGTTLEQRPIPGRLIAHQHAVWRVERVDDIDLDDQDRHTWLNHGMPDPATWRNRPYRVGVTWIAGHRPADWPPDQTAGLATVHPAREHCTWHQYPESGRWPQCSCCGEPVPCQAELEDQAVTAALEHVTKLESRLPGACWGCNEPITSRQRAVTYPGDNLDLPGAHPPTFHTRRRCRGTAQRYEERWLAADPRRERILTYPLCGGTLIVHADGTSECRPGTTPLGDHAEPQPDCQGHLTHNHRSITACYVTGRCPRGCSPASHPGTRTTPRPDRRDQQAAL